MVEFELDGRQVSLVARTPESSEFRVLVDGVPVPMDVTRTETFTGNLGSSTREVEACHPAAWIQIEGTPHDPSIWGPRIAYVLFMKPIVSVYNTSVWSSDSVHLTFADDFTRVAVAWDESTDTSS
ncbi:hypothetical protein [Actinomadura sp. 6N118]|uniref:hypothetical protein n=1 Tax=Actinomadura sp. 6N118 TaxID=3375151 RepID=UPI0037B31E3E